MLASPQKQQKGIVLISCLVFLILILGLLKVSLGSSQITEKQSGIDLDMLSAKESAESVMRSAIDSLIPAPDTATFPSCAEGIETRKCRRARLLAAKRNWHNSVLSDPGDLPASNGRYDGTKQYGACGKGSTGNRPLWQCVNWGNEFHKTYGVKQVLNPIFIGRNAYIVEGFPPEEYGITTGDGVDSVLLRITAFGVGHETPDGRATNAMLQAEYLLQ